MHLYSEPNAPNAFSRLDFSRAQAPRAPWVTPAVRGAGRRPLPYSGWIATPRGTARSRHKPAEDEEASPSICRHAPGPRMIPAPEPLPVPEPRPSPRPYGSWPRPRISQRSPELAHPNTCSELQIFIATASGPRRGLHALRDAAPRRGGGAPAVPPPASRGPDCGG